MNKTIEEAANKVGAILEKLECVHGRNPVLDEARCLLSRLYRKAESGALDPVDAACYLAGLYMQIAQWDEERSAVLRSVYGETHEGRPLTPLDIN